MHKTDKAGLYKILDSIAAREATSNAAAHTPPAPAEACAELGRAAHSMWERISDDEPISTRLRLPKPLFPRIL